MSTARDWKSYEIYLRTQATERMSDAEIEAIRVVFEHGPATTGELKSRSEVGGLGKKIRELERRGVICSIWERPCHVTHDQVPVWALSERWRKARYIEKPAGGMDRMDFHFNLRNEVPTKTVVSTSDRIAALEAWAEKAKREIEMLRGLLVT